MKFHSFYSAAVWSLALAATCSFSPAAETPEPHHGLTPAARNTFLADAERSLRSRASVAPEFWDWLAKHPQIRAGLLSATDPVPPAFAENLDDLRKALGPEIADRYASLLLGASLGERLGERHATGGDGAYNATAFAATGAPEADPRVTKVAAYLKEKKMPLADFVAQENTLFSELSLTPLKPKERGAFLENLAFATGTYPPHRTLALADELKKVIAHYETKLPVFADKGPEWPLFPLDSAPWPLLAPMRQTVSDRELDYLWDHFTGKAATAGKRLITYSRYTFDYEKPEIRYKQSDWHPSSIPRIIEDGGVCGRQSTLAQLSQVALGRPAVGMYQPGHRALTSYRFDAKTGHYSAVREQSITTPEKSTCQWFLPAPLGPRGGGGKAVGIEYHVALALAMDTGLERFTDSRIAFQLANRSDGTQKQELLESAANLNPYNLDAWFALAKLAGSDTTAINHLLAHLDTLLSAPDSGLVEEKELAADTDLSQHAAKEQTADSHRDSNLVAALVGDAIAEEAYSAALADKASLAANRANLRAEMLRRENLKLPHGAKVEGLAYRYDIAIDGVAGVQRGVTAEIQQLTAVKKNARKQQADDVKEHVGLVLQALPKPTERVTWLFTLCKTIPEPTRFQLGHDGKAAPEALYGYLYQELLKSLKATGKTGVAESKRLADELEAARASFESKSKKA